MRRLLVALVGSVVGAAFACGAFGADGQGSTEPSADGASDGGEASSDGALDDADATSSASCMVKARLDSGCARNPNTCAATVFVAQDAAVGSPERYPFGIAVDAKHVYWATQSDYDNGGASTGFLWRAPKTGGPAERITDAQQRADFVAVSSTHVLWRAFDGKTNEWVVVRQPKAASCSPGCPTPERLVKTTAGDPISALVLTGETGVAVHANGKIFYAYEDPITGWTVAPPVSIPNGDMAFDGESILHTTRDDLIVRRIDLDAAAAATDAVAPFHDLPDGAVGEHVAAACGQRIVVFEQTTNNTRAVLDISNPKEPKNVGQGVGAYQIAIDEAFVYFGVPDINGVYRLRRSGGQAALIASGNVFRLAVDDDSIYFGEHGGAALIMRIPK